MKKKLLLFGIVLCVFFSSIGSVFAKDVGFSDIKIRFKELISDESYVIIDDDNKIKVSLNNPTYGDYSIEFNYSDNTISYVNNRDVSSATIEQKIYYSLTDSYFISALLYSLFDVYDISDEAINSKEINYDEMGVLVESLDEIKYTSPDGSATTVSPIKSLSINLSKFDSYTKDAQESNRDLNATKEIIQFFKAILDPMASNMFNGNYEQVVDEVIGDIMDSGEESYNDQKSSNSQSTQKVIVPSTGINSIYILIGFIIASLAFGFLIYFVMINKKTISK